MNQRRYAIHGQLLTLRSLHRLVESDEFLETFEAASAEQQELALVFIDRQDVKALERWVYQLRSRELENLSMRDLRRRAQLLGVANYHVLTKTSLLSAIKIRESQSVQASGRQEKEHAPCV